MNPPNSAVRITFWRPHVSDRKPQKCELTTMPRNDMEFSRPCSVVDMAMSHLTNGITKLMFTFSIAMPMVLRPPIIISSMWNFPYAAGERIRQQQQNTKTNHFDMCEMSIGTRIHTNLSQCIVQSVGLLWRLHEMRKEKCSH